MHPEVNKVLRASCVSFSERKHGDFSVPIRSPGDFALALGYEIGRVSKTLLMRAVERELFYLVALSSNQRVDITELSKALRIKRAQIASKDELSKILGYPHTGVSPINSKGLPVLIEQSLMQYETVLIGSGEVGTEIEITPRDLRQITEASVLAFAI